MFSPMAHTTPGQLVRFGRIAAIVVAMAMTAGYVTNTLTVETASVGAFVLATFLLLAVPDQRSSELLGAAAIWMTVAEFLSANQSGGFELWRWAVSVSALALLMVPIKVQHARTLARTNPYRPFAELDRRSQWSPGLMPKSPSYLVTVRADEAAPTPPLLAKGAEQA